MDTNRTSMNENGERLEIDVKNIEITRETLDQLEGGTEEGVNEVRGHIETAEHVTEDIFEEDGDDLEEIHDKADEFENDLQDTSGTVEKDLERISDAISSVETRETQEELERAKDSASEDKDFLGEQSETLNEILQQSRLDYEALRGRVQTKGGQTR
ncbi:hypothetical protein FJY63_06820 [Candidatus Sumerlaeota bacterium]|nr:hypothetical protein [Candidatus Sumerlaeota bacterium]